MSRTRNKRGGRLHPIASSYARTSDTTPGEESFLCAHCKRTVVPTLHGTRHRNHCPHCLWSRHLDRTPGDRRSSCRGQMVPVAVWVRDGEWVLLHRCERCAIIRGNRIAPDDDLTTLLALAAGPLAHPPLPA
ncbi:RNHCP domain-containing protein [Myxococcota bacterium]